MGMKHVHAYLYMSIILGKATQCDSCYTSPCTAALLKCAFIVAGIVDYPSNESLARQLERKLGSGVELTTFANVPIGSGKAEAMQGPAHT